MLALRTPEWLKKQRTPEDNVEATAPTEAKDTPPQPQRIPTYEELAEVLPNLKRTLR